MRKLKLLHGNFDRTTKMAKLKLLLELIGKNRSQSSHYGISKNQYNNRKKGRSIMIKNDYNKEEKRQRVISIIDRFMEETKGYTIEIYLSHINSSKTILTCFLPYDRKSVHNQDDYSIVWNDEYDKIVITYDDVAVIYREDDECISKEVHIILKNGTEIKIECMGIGDIRGNR